MTFEQCPLNCPARIMASKNVDARLQELGFLDGLDFTLESECIFKGTVVMNCKYGKMCLRRKELDAEVELTQKTTF